MQSQMMGCDLKMPFLIDVWKIKKSPLNPFKIHQSIIREITEKIIYKKYGVFQQKIASLTLWKMSLR